MLSYIRKQAGSWWVKGLYIAIAVTFFGGFGILGSSRIRSCMGVKNPLEAKSGEEVYVTVGKDPITAREFELRLANRHQELLNMLHEKFKDQPIPEALLDRDRLRADVMKGMVREKLLMAEAARLKIKVSDPEVRNYIVAMFSRQNESGNFSLEDYHKFLNYQNLSEAEFEDRVRHNLILNKTYSALESGVQVLPQEVQERYAFDHEKLKLEFAAVVPAAAAAEVMPSDTAVQKYYNDHASDYYLGETRRVQYVSWDVSEVMSGITVSEAELKKYYEESKDRYILKPPMVQASHILIKGAKDSSPDVIAAAKKKIEQVRQEAIAPGADFAALARKYSEDGTRDQGGDLGWFTKQEYRDKFGENLPAMITEFEQAAFALQPGQTSSPIQSDYGFHLIKVTGRKEGEYTPFEKVRPELMTAIKHGKALKLIQARAEEMKKAADGGRSLQAAAALAKKELKLSDWFQQSDAEVFDLPDSKVIVEAGFTLKEGKVSAPLLGEDHVFLVQVSEIKPERQGSLTEVKNRIIARLKPGLELETSLQRAQEALDKLRDGKLTLAAAATELKTKVEVADFMERSMVALPDLASSNTLETVLNKLNPDHPWPQQPVVLSDKVVILHLAGVEPPDLAKFGEDREDYEKKLIAKKQEEVADQWLSDLEKKDVVYKDAWKELLQKPAG